MTRERLKHIIFSLVATMLLLAVFMLYIQPDFLLVLSNQVWACF